MASPVERKQSWESLIGQAPFGQRELFGFLRDIKREGGRRRRRRWHSRAPPLSSSAAADCRRARRSSAARSARKGRFKATWKKEFKLPWREVGPPHHDDKVDSDQ